MRLRPIGLIVTLALAILLAPLATDAQQAAKVYRIGYLGTVPPLAHIWDALLQGLRERGYVEGKNIVFERRFSEGRPERLPALAAELVHSKPNVILTAGGRAPAHALKEGTTTIPIVLVIPGDPLVGGLVPSLARPGGNVTGLSSRVSGDINGKRLELLKEIAPHISRVGVLYWTVEVPPGQDATFSAIYKELEAAAKVLQLQLVPALANNPDQLKEAFATITRERTDAIFVAETGLNFRHRRQIVDFAASNRSPTVFGWRESVDEDGLISYGVSYADLFRRAAGYVEKILKGAKPGDLPVEQPTKFELVVNLKTAKALGLTIPQSILIRADHVIQ